MVKPGYKQTEIGVIPEAWNIRKLSECTKRVGVGLATSVTQHYREDGVPIFRNLNIKPGYLDDSDILYLDPEFANRQESKKVRTGDVLTVHTGYVGISCVVPAKYNNALTFTTLITTTDKHALLPEFLSLYLSSPFGAREIETLQAGGGRNNLNVNDFVNFRIPLPSISEQHKIVEYLKETDCYLKLIDQQLSKKKAIKQGAMQELLTGKKRLPGYEAPWISKRLQDIAPLQRGFDLPYSELAEGHVPVFFSNGINAYHRVAMVKGPGIITGRSGTIGKLHYVDSDYWPHNTTLWVTDFKGNNPRFIYYLLHLVNWTDYMTGSGVPTLNRNDVHSKVISIPEKKEEQEAIVAILLSMDSEIEALEQKMKKYRQIKHGMVQQLLTGKIRLV